MNTDKIDYLSFRVGSQWYGVTVYDVIEVIHFVALDELPSTAPEILGLLTLRKMVLPVIDLRILFGISADPELNLSTPIVVINMEKSPIGIVVDDVDDVVHISDIADYNGTESAYIKHVANLPDKLLLLLDTSKLKSIQTVTTAEPRFS